MIMNAVKCTVFISICFLLACNSKKPVNSVNTFEQFSIANPVSATDNCVGNLCKSRKQELAYLAYVAENIYCYWEEKQKLYSFLLKYFLTTFV